MISTNCKKLHLITKLYNRELYGQFIKGKQPIEPTRQLFSTIPSRLIFPLKSTIPNIGNHILMGATKCGRFLITYTFQFEPLSELPPRFCYRLHFWSFIPGGKAKLVSEVKLFDNSIVIDMLTIKIVQWPNIMNRLIVFGSWQGDVITRGTTESEEEGDQSIIYMTIATTPCLNCQECSSRISVKQDEESEKMGHACSRHGLTIHTWFTIPNQCEFNPNISCTNDNQIVVNVGSFIHMVEFSVSDSNGVHSVSNLNGVHGDRSSGRRESNEGTEPLSSGWSDSSKVFLLLSPQKYKTDHLPIVNAHLVNRLSYSFLRNNSYMIILSDSWVNKMIYLLVKWINLGNQAEIKDLPYYLKFAIQKNSEEIRSLNVGNVSRILLHSANVMQTLYMPCQEQRPKWFSSDKTNRISHYSAKKQASEPPDKVYDFKEDIQSCSKYDAFRRLCRADKVYNFDSDEEKNLENIPSNIDGSRRRAKHAWSKRSSKEEARDVAIARFVTGLGRENSKIRKRWKRPQIPLSDWMGPKFEITEEVISAMDEGFGHQPVPLHSVLTRKTYVEVEGNGEILCTMIDDDDETGVCMPLMLHGSGYQYMGRVASQNNDVDTLNVFNVRVTQCSLDVEGVCSLAAEMVCKAEKFKFNYIVDYDTQIVQTCPLTGDILLLVYIQLSAENLSVKKRGNNIKTELYYCRRKSYDCQVLAVWSPKNKRCYLEGYSGLTEVTSPSEKQRPWTAKREASRLRSLVKSTFGVPSKGVKSLVHKATDGQLFSSTLILDHDNLIGFKKT